MNWTGGRLQRHSKQGSSALNRQKQHFAKVRTALQNGSLQHYPPFKPSFLRDDDGVLGGHLPPFGDRSTRHVGHPKSRQKALEEYDSVAPVAKRLSSLGSLSHHWGSRLQQEKVTSPRHGVHADSPNSAQSSTSRDVQNRKKHFKRTKTSPREVLSRTRSNRSLSKDQLSSEPLLEAKKRKLLEHDDWVGLALSRPVHMQFVSTTEKERIGKRRKIESSMRERLGGEARRVLTPIEGNNRNVRGPFMSGTLPHKDDISIRIGTDALVSRHSTQLGAEQGVSVRLTAQSSDPMLLDDDTVARDAACDRQLSLLGVDHRESDGGHQRLPVFISPSIEEATPSPVKHRSSPQRNTHGMLRLRDPEIFKPDHPGFSLQEQAMLDIVPGPGLNTDASGGSLPQRLVECVGLGDFGIQQAAAATAPFRLVFESSSQNRHHDSEMHEQAAHSLDRDHYQSHQDQPEDTSIVEEGFGHFVGDEPWKAFLPLSAAAPSRIMHTGTSYYNTRHGRDIEEAGPYEATDIDGRLRSLHATLGSSDESSTAPVQAISTVAHVSAPSTNTQKSRTETQQSTSASLRQITDLTRKQAREPSAPDNGDDAWRKFVFGDVSSSRPDSALESSVGDIEPAPCKKAQVSSSQWSLAAGERTSSDRQTRVPQIMAEEPHRSSQGSVLSGQSEGHGSAAGEEYPTASMYNNAALSEGSSVANSSPRRRKQVKSTAATYQTSTQDEHSSPDPLAISNIHAAVESVRTGRARPKKIVFTKPAAFIGNGSESHTVRIGSKKLTGRRTKVRRRQTPDSIYDIPLSNEIDNEVDMIED